MRIVLSIVVAILLSSCMTQERVNKICATCPTHDSVVVKTMIEKQRYDSLIYITSAPETLSVASPCDSVGKLKIFDVKTKKNGMSVEIKSDGKQLTASCMDDSLQQVIKGLNTIIKEKDFTSKEKTRTVYVEKPFDWWTQTCRKGFPICLIAIGLFFGFKIAKLYFKF